MAKYIIYNILLFFIFYMVISDKEKSGFLAISVAQLFWSSSTLTNCKLITTNQTIYISLLWIISCLPWNITMPLCSLVFYLNRKLSHKDILFRVSFKALTWPSFPKFCLSLSLVFCKNMLKSPTWCFKKYRS